MSSPLVHPYVPNTAPATKAAMLGELGVADVEEFYADVPADLRVVGELALPPALPAEQDLVKHVNGLLAKNRSTDERLSFLGYGTYQHYVPAVVDEVISRSEFLTAYAGEPYEDHGRFQALFEYQSLMAELLAMDVVNVPTYDGYQATATGLAMAGRISSRPRIIAVSEINPDKLAKVTNYLEHRQRVDLIATRDGTADVVALKRSIDSDVAAVWVETPALNGAIEPQLREIAMAAHAAGALLVVGTDPLCYGVLEPPAAAGADIVTGDIQSLGLHQWFGGARGGFIAVHDDPKYVMEMPSRLFGLASTDVPGEYGFGDVAYDRTSFALREEGKEWVGTAAALWGIAAGVYLALMGPQGMKDIGETVIARTRYAQQRLGSLPGVALRDQALHFREFVVEFADVNADDVSKFAHARGVDAGVVLDDRTLLVCVTEMTSAKDIDRLVDVIRMAVAGGDEQRSGR